MGNPVSPADAGTVAGGRVTGTNGTLPCTQAWLAGLRLCGCAERVPLSAPPPPVLQCSGAWVTESLRTLGNKVAPLQQISGPRLCWVGGFLTLEALVTPRAPVSQPLSFLVLTRAHEAGRATAAPSQVRWK